MGNQDLYSKQLVRKLDDYTQGVGLVRHDTDRDMLTKTNSELIMRGIDPRTGKIFNHYLCHEYARHGDPIAKETWRNYVYEQSSENLRARLNADVAVSYNRLMQSFREAQMKYGAPKY